MAYPVPIPADYEAIPGREANRHPHFYIHNNALDLLNGQMPEVDFDNQARLHSSEIPNLVEGSDVRPPVVFIDHWQPPYPHNPEAVKAPRRTMSNDSYRQGEAIHINLRQGWHAGRPVANEASAERLARELITQSVARAIEERGGLLKWPDYKHEFWLPLSLGAFVGLAFSILGPDVGGVFLGLGTAGAGSAINARELKQTKYDRIKEEAGEVIARLLPRHRADFTF